MANLEIGGIDCRNLAAVSGTPLLVYDEEKIETQFAAATENFKSQEFDTEVVYAAKAFSCTAIFEKAQQAGAGLDVVSGGELYCARQAGVDMKKVYFHGNNKSTEELEMALKLGCGTIVLDNDMECERLITLSEREKISIDVLLRVNPGIEAHTHEYIQTSGSDSKFGISIKKTEQIQSLAQKVLDSSYVNFKGFHSHIGSQITETEGFEKALEIMISFISDMKQQGVPAEVLSIGGGFGIRYTEEDQPIPLGEMAARLARICEKQLAEKNLQLKKLIMEPGRSIVGEAGYSLYKVGFSKDTDTKHFLFVDGGMSDNIRPALYQAKYSCDIATRMGEAKDKTYCVAGKNCESGDILIQEAQLPSSAAEGDLLVIYAAGAYGYSMASNYNRAGRPEVVFVKKGKARRVLKRETYQDQLRLETDEQLIF
ncbi:MAG: diaminopimelate decarboxylase [Firmicutes bacterium]|jgi:diaminopimelate decarboxylase|nr:diaminopimelate decarboxylase [Bacillota bacterium]NBI62431.1 diaminopimelate decarboxylase [Clostridiales bacterium]